MGEDLHREFDFVREIFDMAEEITKVKLSRLCFKGPMEELTQTVNLQPALTAVNLACLAALRRQNADFTTCAGHSLGEYNALHASGVIAQEDTMRLVFQRGQLMHREASKHRGAMQAIIGLSMAEVGALVAEGQQQGIVSVANHNMETQIVITGAPDPVARVGAVAAAKGAKAVPLKVSGAWHSELIRGAEAEFKEALSKQPSGPSGDRLNVTGAEASDPAEIREIMSRQLCSPVRWYDSMCRMKASGVGICGVVREGLDGPAAEDPTERLPGPYLQCGSLAQLEGS
jgi:[acyl-carrier-protein] S-malonyltransferase